MRNKKPWNIPDVPIYSVSTKNGEHYNMNICTYVTAVSMKPKRYMVAVYYPTLTYENISQSNEFVLQLLSESQANIVRYLGQKTGFNFNKSQWLDKQNTKDETHPYRSEIWQGFKVLSHAKAYLHLQIRDSWDAGDHKMFLCDVLKYKVSKVDVKELTLNYLRLKKLVRM